MSHRELSRRQLLRDAGRYGLAVASLMGVGGALTACADSRSTASSGDITVGHLFSRTGSVAAVGQAAAGGVLMRIDEANESGGIKSLGGAKINLIEADDQSKPEVAAGELARLAEQGAQVCIGSVGSPAMLQATQEAERQQVSIVNSVSVLDQINQRGFRYTFTSCGNSQRYTEDFVLNTKTVLDQAGYRPKKVGVLFESNIQGPFYADAMRKFFPQYTKWDVSYYDYPLDTNDFEPLLQRLRGDGVDVVVLASYAKDGALILQSMQTMRYDVGLIAGCMGGLISREFITSAGDAAEGFVGESYWVEHLKLPGLQGFLDKARQGQSGPVDPFTALGYAAASVVVDALERAGSTDKAKIHEAIAATDLSAGENGFIAPGGVKFDATGANSAIRGVYYQIKDGQQQAVLPKEFAVTEPTVPHATW
ncbi:amino acid/amide ABC transporter substrate-binding protein, HAAT family [Pseudonocardia thermophila]|uniref:Amino acid/amide ABC transporter substrate-binding protein, HAAT family n=1 Tax=Pseudonocardia thermophila TaxID=1848 RepID=A0A1M6U5M1_PSETH|nr:ABC transporter substrate-binding protein [Pseudonocardia thermophila]SHK64441.1 amino acid/amide ABC transporter substrate-binding protein, HAAT family [Pseudonocardia thermophila]